MRRNFTYLDARHYGKILDGWWSHLFFQNGKRAIAKGEIGEKDKKSILRCINKGTAPCRGAWGPCALGKRVSPGVRRPQCEYPSSAIWLAGLVSLPNPRHGNNLYCVRSTEPPSTVFPTPGLICPLTPMPEGAQSSRRRPPPSIRHVVEEDVSFRLLSDSPTLLLPHTSLSSLSSPSKAPTASPFLPSLLLSSLSLSVSLSVCPSIYHHLSSIIM